MELKRYRVVAVGANKANILSDITGTLSEHNYEIETISSVRLGHSIVVICILEASQNSTSIKNCLHPVVEENYMTLVVDECLKGKFNHVRSEVYMRFRGYHETGIKAYIISELIHAGFDIHGLESDTNLIDDLDEFQMDIKGVAKQGFENISKTIDKLGNQNIKTSLADNYKQLISEYS